VVYFDAFYDSHEGEKPIKSIISRWHGSPFTPVTGVRLPVGTPIIKTRGYGSFHGPFLFMLIFIPHYIPDIHGNKKGGGNHPPPLEDTQDLADHMLDVDVRLGELY
jgi:hypothetical protein